MEKQLKYNEPWILQRADPYVYRHTDGTYYFTASVPEYDRIVLRSAAQRAKWMGGKDEKRVFCVDCGMEEETRRICETVCREYRFMEIITPEELGVRFRPEE